MGNQFLLRLRLCVVALAFCSVFIMRVYLFSVKYPAHCRVFVTASPFSVSLCCCDVFIVQLQGNFVNYPAGSRVLIAAVNIVVDATVCAAIAVVAATQSGLKLPLMPRAGNAGMHITRAVAMAALATEVDVPVPILRSVLVPKGQMIAVGFEIPTSVALAPRAEIVSANRRNRGMIQECTWLGWFKELSHD